MAVLRLFGRLSVFAGSRLVAAGALHDTGEGVSLYKVGDKVVYPHHGAGTIVKRERREVLGETREYLTIKILHNDMTVNVPADNAERVGLRKVIDEEAVKKVVKYLTSGGTEMPKNWNRRFKHNRDKMKTGDIFELAEVVRNLSLRDGEKGLSTGEKQMYVKAKKILASELMYAKNLSEDDAFAWLEGVLTGPETLGDEAAGGEEAGRREVDAEDASRRVARQQMSVWAVLVAAGRGERLGDERPKAFARLGDLPLLAEPLRRLDESDWIDGIVVVAPPEWEEPAILLAEEIGASKVDGVRHGRRDPLGVGADRARRGARERRRRARPRRGAAVPAAGDRAAAARGARRGLRRRRAGASGHGHGEARAGRRRRRDAAPRRARRRADAAGVRRGGPAPARRGEGSDCASLVEAAGGRVKVVPGDERLLKVTTPDDLRRVEAWLAAERGR